VATAKRKRSKLFVIDTNVLLHDPTSLHRFEEHDLYIPITVLEELDNNKKGTSDVARNARQVSRLLDEIVRTSPNGIDKGIDLKAASKGLATGRLFFQSESIDETLPASLPSARGDNQILAVLIHLAKTNVSREVVLVSKDINMRIKARALGQAAQDYFNDKVLDDRDLLDPGYRTLPATFWETHAKGLKSWKDDGRVYYAVSGPLAKDLTLNQFVTVETEPPFYARVKEKEGPVVVLESVLDYAHAKLNVWGILARNVEQNFALNLLMDPDIDLVTLLGQAGSGKTLLTLAAALTQALEMKRYAEIIVTRATVSVGEDIGFLPGTEEEKMTPWMGLVEDTLDVLLGGTNGDEWSKNATRDIVKSRIKVKSMNFMRGRTFLDKFVIIDEAQNLTPKQMKTLITRAGPGTKMVCLGNMAQIDSPFLTEASSGLAVAVDRFRDWPHAGHVTLAQGERSRLADRANEVL
jgi:PhoH-like ATPase